MCTVRAYSADGYSGGQGCAVPVWPLDAEAVDDGRSDPVLAVTKSDAAVANARGNRATLPTQPSDQCRMQLHTGPALPIKTDAIAKIAPTLTEPARKLGAELTEGDITFTYPTVFVQPIGIYR